VLILFATLVTRIFIGHNVNLGPGVNLGPVNCTKHSYLTLLSLLAGGGDTDKLNKWRHNKWRYVGGEMCSRWS